MLASSQMLDSPLWPSSNGKTGPPRPTFLEGLAIRDPSAILGGITTTLLHVLAYRQKHLGIVLSALAKNYGRRKQTNMPFLVKVRSGLTWFRYNNDEVIEDFLWMNTTYRYVAFDSPSWLLCNTPTYMLLLQTFFNCKPL